MRSIKNVCVAMIAVCSFAPSAWAVVLGGKDIDPNSIQHMQEFMKDGQVFTEITTHEGVVEVAGSQEAVYRRLSAPSDDRDYAGLDSVDGEHTDSISEKKKPVPNTMDGMADSMDSAFQNR